MFAQYGTKNFEFKLDLRTSTTVAALNAGIINAADLLDVSDRFYYFPDGDDEYVYVNFSTTFDPKYPDMSAIYYNNEDKANSRKFVQRLGGSLWSVEISGWYYSWSGSGGNSFGDSTFTGPYTCSEQCSTDASYCSTPDYVFVYSGLDLNTYEDNGNSFSVNLYANEMFTINEGNMDPGRIGCATTTKGSDGKLGNMEPISAAAFQANLDATPFKLTEDYFACTPQPATAFFDSVGIAQGNSALFFTLVMAGFMFFASRAGFVETSEVNDEVIADNSKVLIEALQLSANGNHDSFSDKHKELQAAFKAFFAVNMGATTSPTSENVLKHHGKPSKQVELTDSSAGTKI